MTRHNRRAKDDSGFIMMNIILALVVLIILIVVMIVWPQVIIALALMGGGVFLMWQRPIPWPPLNSGVAIGMIILGAVILLVPGWFGLTFVNADWGV